jgi:putative membrane protein
MQLTLRRLGTTRLINTLWAGALSGLLATIVKTVCELIAPPRAKGVESPLGITLHKLGVYASYAEPTVHLLFGTVVAVGYALLAERVRWVTAGCGALFGFAFWLVAHEIALPLMGLSPTPAQMSLWEQGNELVTHVIYGVVVELSRRYVRARQSW